MITSTTHWFCGHGWTVEAFCTREFVWIFRSRRTIIPRRTRSTSFTCQIVPIVTSWTIETRISFLHSWFGDSGSFLSEITDLLRVTSRRTVVRIVTKFRTYSASRTVVTSWRNRRKKNKELRRNPRRSIDNSYRIDPMSILPPPPPKKKNPPKRNPTKNVLSFLSFWKNSVYETRCSEHPQETLLRSEHNLFW